MVWGLKWLGPPLGRFVDTYEDLTSACGGLARRSGLKLIGLYPLFATVRLPAKPVASVIVAFSRFPVGNLASCLSMGLVAERRAAVLGIRPDKRYIA